MRRFFLFLIFVGLIWLFPGRGAAAEFKLKDGTIHKGLAISPTTGGVLIKLEGSGSFTSRIAWEKFSQEALKELVKDPKIAKFVEVLIEIPPEEMKEEPDQLAPKVKKKLPVSIKEFPSPGRPVQKSGLIGALFTTKIGFLILLVLYAGNIFAGYEVAVYRNRPAALVCGVSAAAPLIGPVVFLCLPRPYQASEEEQPMEQPEEEVPMEEIVEAEETVEDSAPAAPAKPEPLIFKRGEFSFNRRFFETRFSGFFKIMPSEAEKNLVLVIKCAKGEFIGKRISKISATELNLQLFSAGASSEESIVFNDIFEVQVRQKDEA